MTPANPGTQLGPQPGHDYPTSLGEFLDWFQTEEACRRYLVQVRWPDGFSCSVAEAGAPFDCP